LEVFHAAAAEAVELAGRKLSGSAAVEEDFGPASTRRTRRGPDLRAGRISERMKISANRDFLARYAAVSTSLRDTRTG
jgi:hypothetical protein